MSHDFDLFHLVSPRAPSHESKKAETHRLRSPPPGRKNNERKSLSSYYFKIDVFRGKQKRYGEALSDLCSYHRFDGTMVNPSSLPPAPHPPPTRNYIDERFIFKDSRKKKITAFYRLISVYGSHCGVRGKTTTKFGLAELVGFSA